MTDARSRPADARPAVKLRPRGGRRFSEGAPWIYVDEIAMDRRTRSLAPGTVVTVVSVDGDDRQPLGAFAFNPESTIAARLLDDDPAAAIDVDWIAGRLGRALALRETLYDTPFYRLVHAEGDGLPGVVMDRFGDAVVVQPNAAWADARIDALAQALDTVLAPRTIVMNAGSRARALEGLDADGRVLKGAIDGPIPVAMNGAVYMADLAGGQKTGLFYDQRPNHAFAARLGRGRAVLDVFAHVGGFGLAALAAGAAHALAVDGSAAALALAAEGARRTGVAHRFETMKADAFDALKGLAEAERRFGMVVCDPPAFAPSRQALDAGLRAYAKTARLAAPLVEPGGFLVLCSCSHAADLDSFRAACVNGISATGRRGALIHAGGAGPDHPVHLGLPETGYLKALFF
ncbi:MAG: RSP_2647 family RNA methyltransferase, partial [Rubrimonas sp.]